MGTAAGDDELWTKKWGKDVQFRIWVEYCSSEIGEILQRYSEIKEAIYINFSSYKYHLKYGINVISYCLNSFLNSCVKHMEAGLKGEIIYGE